MRRSDGKIQLLKLWCQSQEKQCYAIFIITGTQYTKTSALLDHVKTLLQGQSCSWIVGTMIITVTVSGCSHSVNRAGFCDTCAQFCRQSDQEDQDPPENNNKKKRHQSEQSQRVRREGVPVPEETDVIPLVKDDSHVSVINSGSRRGSLVNQSQATLISGQTGSLGSTQPGEPVSASQVSQCGCWCQGWCEVLVRRPAGVTSWVCRLQNGEMSNTPGAGHDTLADITSILRPDLQTDKFGKSVVQRSSSSPSIGDLQVIVTRQTKPIISINNIKYLFRVLILPN